MYNKLTLISMRAINLRAAELEDICFWIELQTRIGILSRNWWILKTLNYVYIHAKMILNRMRVDRRISLQTHTHTQQQQPKKKALSKVHTLKSHQMSKIASLSIQNSLSLPLTCSFLFPKSTISLCSACH